LADGKGEGLARSEGESNLVIVNALTGGAGRLINKAGLLVFLRPGRAGPTAEAATVLNEGHSDFNASLPAHLSSVGLARASHDKLKLAWD